jgi:hypothetical protein
MDKVQKHKSFNTQIIYWLTTLSLAATYLNPFMGVPEE